MTLGCFCLFEPFYLLGIYYINNANMKLRTYLIAKDNDCQFAFEVDYLTVLEYPEKCCHGKN